MQTQPAQVLAQSQPPSYFLSDWQCQTTLLSGTLYRKFQHASLHNPIKNTSFTLEKKKIGKANKGAPRDVLFKGRGKYQLPFVKSGARGRGKLLCGKENQPDRSGQGEEGMSMGMAIGKKIASKADSMMTTARESIVWTQNNCELKHKIYKLRQVLQKTFKFGQRDKYFSYFYNVIQQICTSLSETDSKQQTLSFLIADLQLLTNNIDKNRSVLNTIKKLTLFKKNSKYFDFKRPQIRVLYHVILAQLQFYENNLEKCLNELEFCQYYSRKEGLENLTLCFLWEMAQINVSLLKYEEADGNLRNLIEMAVICKRPKAIKYAFQKISLIYYYRGNSIMGQHYLKKSDEGLTTFQAQMYSKEYSRNDEIKRLENRLFNFPIQEKIVKRKNNPKYQSDIWRESKEDYEKQIAVYMDSVNSMIKDHEHARLGREIKKIVRKTQFVGTFTKLSPISMNPQTRNSLDSPHPNLRNSSPSPSPINRVDQKQRLLQKQTIQDNITKVIKTHLSLNRENNGISREGRWRRVVGFVCALEAELRDIGDGDRDGDMGGTGNKGFLKLKTLNNDKDG